MVWSPVNLPKRALKSPKSAMREPNSWYSRIFLLRNSYISLISVEWRILAVRAYIKATCQVTEWSWKRIQITFRDLHTKVTLKDRDSLYNTITPPDGTPPVRLAGQKNRLYPGMRGIFEGLMAIVSTNPRTSGFELTMWRYNGSLGLLSLNCRPAPGLTHSIFKRVLFAEGTTRLTLGHGTL